MNQIDVRFNVKTRRLVLTLPIYMADVAREFPARRFDPRTKTWSLPLVKSNIVHLKSVEHKYQFVFDDAALAAIEDYERLCAQPQMVPFPSHIYDFTRSSTKLVPMKHQMLLLDNTWALTESAWFARMGTGKTFAAIHLAFARWQFGQIDAVVIICPSTLRSVWRKELAKYATGPYDYRTHDTRAAWYDDYCRAKPRDALQILAVSVEGLGVSAGLYDSVCQFYSNGKRIMTIVDESSRIKNPDAKRTKRTIELGAVSAYRLILNGTPIALGIQDLWSQYEFLNPNIVGTGDYYSFKSRYAVMGGYEARQIIGYRNVDELMVAVKPYTTVVDKDVLDLPPKVMTERFVEITAEQRKYLRLIAKGSSPDPAAPYIKAENVLEKLLRARQVVGGWLPKGNITHREIDGQMVESITTELIPLRENPKLDALLETIEDNYDGSKFIIWSTFVHEIEAIRDRLITIYGAPAVECYFGGTSMNDRSRVEDSYCNDPKMRFFIGHPSAAGLGLTLVSDYNDVMLYYSGTNAYIDRAQSEDRAHRKGQTNTVTIVDFIAEKTIDEVIIESIRNKMDVDAFVTTRLRGGQSITDLIIQD